MAKRRFPVLLVSLALMLCGASPASAVVDLTNARGQVDGRLPDWQRIIDARVR